MFHYLTLNFQLEQKREIDPDKPLPTNRKTINDFELGYQEPDLQRIPLGKCTLRQAIKFISDHQQKPEEISAEKIAEEFKLKQQNVEHILEHFRMFAIHIPKEEGKTKKYLIDPFDTQSVGFEKMLEESRYKKKEVKK